MKPPCPSIAFHTAVLSGYFSRDMFLLQGCSGHFIAHQSAKRSKMLYQEVIIVNPTPLPSTTPEALGIQSQDVQRFLDALEHSGSELHGLVMMRHGKIFAQGAWAPYAPGVVHAQQSLTKTLTGAAYGAAELLGILDLKELVIDIFPEYAALTSGPYWDELKVYHLLTMSSGMESQHPVNAEDWMRGFFTMPIVHQPGTAMYYNSAACSLVGACIRRRSGLSLLDFLRVHVLDKIGIDGQRVKWLRHPDGQENGSGGILTTTEDNARLMQLYLQHGQWNGEQIISRCWADMATSLQNPHAAGDGPEAPLGYGGMMWIRPNCYYADGGMGQYAVVFPEKQLVICLNETLSTPDAAQKIHEALFHFDRFAQAQPLPPDEHASRGLQDRLSRLSIPAPPLSTCQGTPPRGTLHIRHGEVPLFADDFKIFAACYQDSVQSLSLHCQGSLVTLQVKSASGTHTFHTSTDGRRWHNHTQGNSLATELCLSAWWSGPQTLVFEFRWIESCRLRTVALHFDDGGAEIQTTLMRVGGFDEGPWHARAEIEH